MKERANILYTCAWLLAFWRWNCVTVISTVLHLNPSLLNLLWLAMIVGITGIAWVMRPVVFKKGIIAVVIMLAFYALSFYRAFNERGLEYFNNFTRYVVMGAFLIIQIDPDRLEKATDLFCWSCVGGFFIFGFLPFTGPLNSYNAMAFYETGMVYGESVIAPCFIGIFTLYMRRRNILLLGLSAVCLGLGAILANRSTLLVCLFFAVVYNLWIEKIDTKRAMLYIFLAALALVIFLNLHTILLLINDILSGFGIHSYALTKYAAALDPNARGSSSDFMSGRGSTLGHGIQFFEEHPLLGIGFGTFYMRTGEAYVHNIFIDWFTTLGAIGGTIMLIMTVIAVWKVLHVKDETTKIFSAILLTLWFPRLFFSKTFADDIEYWTFLVFALSLKYYAATNEFNVSKSVRRKIEEILYDCGILRKSGLR